MKKENILKQIVLQEYGEKKHPKLTKNQFLLSSELYFEVERMYKELGGTQEEPPLKFGAWDISTPKFIMELEESESLNRIKFDLAFFGAASLSDGQVSFEDQEDVLMKKRAFKTSKIRVLLAETSKINKHSHYILSELTDFDYWITDKEPDLEIQQSLDGKTTILF